MACQPIYKLHQIHTDYLKNQWNSVWFNQDSAVLYLSQYFILMWLYQRVVLQVWSVGPAASALRKLPAGAEFWVPSKRFWIMTYILTESPGYSYAPSWLRHSGLCLLGQGRTVSCTRKRGGDGDSAQVAVRVQYLSEKSYDSGSDVRRGSYLGIQ